MRTQTKTKKQMRRDQIVEWFLILYPALQMIALAAFFLFAWDQCKG